MRRGCQQREELEWSEERLPATGGVGMERREKKNGLIFWNGKNNMKGRADGLCFLCKKVTGVKR